MQSQLAKIQKEDNRKEGKKLQDDVTKITRWCYEKKMLKMEKRLQRDYIRDCLKFA